MAGGKGALVPHPLSMAQVQGVCKECYFYSTNTAAFELDLLVRLWFKTHTSGHAHIRT